MANIEDSQSYHFSSQAPARNFSMPMAIAIAVIVHLGIIFGIGFSMSHNLATLMQDVAKALRKESLYPFCAAR